MDSPCDTAKAVGCPIRRSEDHRALAPPLGFSQRATSFIASRCQGIHQMPFCAAPAPSPKHAAKTRGQMTEIRTQTGPRPTLRSDLAALLAALEPVRRHRPADARASAYAYPCPGPTIPATAGTAGPASRSQLASRCHKIRGQRSEIRPDGTGRCPLPRHNSRFRCHGCRRQKTPQPRADVRAVASASVLCPLISDLTPRRPGGPGPIRTADLTLIRRAL